MKNNEIEPAICYNCKHRHGPPRTEVLTCDAFPEGIPRTILINETDHRKPVPGDNGVRYEPINPGYILPTFGPDVPDVITDAIEV